MSHAGDMITGVAVAVAGCCTTMAWSFGHHSGKSVLVVCSELQLQLLGSTAEHPVGNNSVGIDPVHQTVSAADVVAVAAVVVI